MPQKKSLLFFAASMAIFFLGLIILLFLQGRTRPSLPTALPTLVPTTATGTTTGIRIVSTSPAENELAPIATNTLTYTFSGDVSAKAVRAELFEELTGVNVPVNPVSEKNTITVTILRPLAPDSGYRATLRLLDGSVFTHVLTFRTRQGQPVDTYPIGIPEKVEELNRQNHPDIFVANKLPYGTETFSMSSTIQNDGKILFTVKGKAAEAKSWLLSLGLTEAQIATLAIHYTQ